VFQSTPGIEAGRSLIAPSDGVFFRLFQSTPGIEAGRSSLSG